jgi:hypothetical protein
MASRYRSQEFPSLRGEIDLGRLDLDLFFQIYQKVARIIREMEEAESS